MSTAMPISAKDFASTHSCGCVGPQNGEPLCPCKMRGVVVKNGRYVIPERDIGPAKPTSWDVCYKMMRATAAQPARALQSGFGRFDA